MKHFKTTEPVRRKARNWLRRKKGIPEDAPLQTRALPMNGPRRGSGNIEGKISMSPRAWELLKRIKGGRTMGETVSDALHLMEK